VHIPNNRLFATIEELREKKQGLCLSRPAPLDVPEIGTGTAYWIAMARKNWLGHSRNSYIYSDYEGFVDPMSSGFAYDRSVFDKAGYFDESFDAAEDVEFHYRLKQAGISAYTSPSLLIYSYPRASFSGLFHQQTRYGAGRAKLVTKHPGALTKETPVPSLIFIFFVLSLLAFMVPYTPRALQALFIAGTSAYALLLLAVALAQAAKQQRILMAFPVALAIWITHMGLGWGFLKTFVRLKSGMLQEKT
jgi:succinoglycan biosynthesis protein ExoA